MDLYQIISFPLYAGGILEVMLGIALLKQAHRSDRAMRAAATLFFLTAVFVLFTAISYTLESQGRSFNFFNRASWIGWFMIPACFQFIYYLQDEQSRKARLVGYILYPFWGVVLALTLFTNLVEPGDASLIPFVAVDGPLENPARLIGSLLAIWLLVEVYRTKKRMTGIKKAQMNLFFYGTLFFNVGCILIAGILPLFGAVNPAMTAFFSLPWVVIAYYAITRHRLFDMRLMVARVLNIAFLGVILSVIHLVLFHYFRTVLGETVAILLSLSFIGLLFFGTQLSATLQLWVQRLVLKNRYDYQSVLRESIRAVITILQRDELLDYIVASIKKSLGVEKASLALQQDHRQTPSGPRARADAAVLGWLRQHRQIILQGEIERAGDDGAAVDEYLKSKGAELIIPLLYKDEVRGYIELGPKGGNDPYLQSDIDLLEMLAGQAAVAMENARLYEDAQRARRFFKESEEKFRTLAETAAMAIFIHQGGNFLYANRAAAEIGGYPIDEYLTMNFMSLVHPDFIDLVKARARERLDGGGVVPTQYEFMIVRKDGGERWVLMTAGISMFEGRPSVIGTLIDITERKRAEQEREEYFGQLQLALQSLKESELRFRTLAETTTAAIFIHQGRKLVYANAAGSAMTGYSNEELLREDFWSLIHPDYQEMVRERGLARIQGRQLQADYEYKFIRKDGEECWVSMTAGLIEFSGKPAIIATLFDITARKQAEEALRESEVRYRALFEQAGDYVLLLEMGRDNIPVIVDANESALRAHGYDRGEILGRPITIIDPELPPDIAAERARVMSNDRLELFHVRHRRKDGTMIDVEVHSRQVHIGGRQFILSVERDITEWKRAEEAKVKFYEESVRQYQERIEMEKRYRVEKEKLLMDLHDGIGGITTNISILSELARKAKDQESVGKMLATISQLSREGIAEVRGFMHSLDSRDLTWRTLAVELRNQGTNMIKAHNIGFTIDSDVQDIPEQPGSLTWVNIFKIYKEALTNVIKHSKASEVSVGFRVDSGAVLLTIRDNGIGVKDSRPGGRGLSHMKTRAIDIGGTVAVSNETGTAIKFMLPFPLKYPAAGMAIQ